MQLPRFPRLLAACCACLFQVSYGVDLPVDDVAAFERAVKEAKPGDSIVLRDGEWLNATLVFKGQGEKDAPITLKAANPGKTILTGECRLRIGGEHLVVDGIHFRDPNPAAQDTIEFRVDSKTLARHCRLTNCAVTLVPNAFGKDAPESRWVNLYGAANRVDHCRIEGKENPGTTLVVWLGRGNEGGHQIDSNYFGPRPPLGKNGGETIRVGDSQSSMQKANCVVERNLFERCDGEAECISNKSCGNTYRENTFLSVSGALTLRHGNDCIVERNVFVGQKAPGTGGVRIIGEGHVIRGNYFAELAGDDARCGITLMMGIPKSPLNGYFQVKGVRIEENVLVDCKHPVLIGLADAKKATLPPVETTFARNRIDSPNRLIVEARCKLDGITWEENTFHGNELGIPPTDGITWEEPELSSLQPLARKDVGPAWGEP